MGHVLCVDIVILILTLSFIKDISKLQVHIRSSKLIVNQALFNICEHYRRLQQVAPSLTNFIQYSRP